MAYVPKTWVDEVLAGSVRYDTKTDAGVPIDTNIQIALNTTVVTPGTAMEAGDLNNIEDGLVDHDARLDDLEAPDLLVIDEGGSTTTPAADKVKLYAKADGLLYSKDDAGTETPVSSGGGGNPVKIFQAMPPQTLAATIDYRPGGSTPAESLVVWDFSDSVIEYMDFKGYLTAIYGSGGLTFKLPWSAETAVSGTVQWEAAIRAFPSDAEDIDAAHTYVYNAVVSTTASASGEIIYATITFTDGADMDSLAAGEEFILRVRRNKDGTDTVSGDAELHMPIGSET